MPRMCALPASEDRPVTRRKCFSSYGQSRLAAQIIAEVDDCFLLAHLLHNLKYGDVSIHEIRKSRPNPSIMLYHRQ